MSKTSPHDQLIRYRLNRAEEAYQVVNFQVVIAIQFNNSRVLIFLME